MKKGGEGVPRFRFRLPAACCPRLTFCRPSHAPRSASISRAPQSMAQANPDSPQNSRGGAPSEVRAIRPLGLSHEPSPSTFVLRKIESILYPQSYCPYGPSRLHFNFASGGFPLNGSERRTTQRFQMRLPLTVRWTTGAAVGETSTESRDVSSRGVYFFLAKDVKEGSPVEILLTLPNEITLAGPVRVRCLGRVQRTETRDQGAIGVVAAIERYEFLRGDEDKH